MDFDQKNQKYHTHGKITNQSTFEENPSEPLKQLNNKKL